MPAVQKKPSEGLKTNERKWTKPLMKAGWLAFPTVILERQQALGLGPVDLNILLHIAKHWWEKDRLPFPSKTAIAECMGVSNSTVQRRIAAMERDGLIKRIYRYGGNKGQQQNMYDLSGLIESVTPYAKELLKAREKQKMENAARRTRKSLPNEQGSGE